MRCSTEYSVSSASGSKLFFDIYGICGVAVRKKSF